MAQSYKNKWQMQQRQPMMVSILVCTYIVCKWDVLKLILSNAYLYGFTMSIANVNDEVKYVATCYNMEKGYYNYLHNFLIFRE